MRLVLSQFVIHVNKLKVISYHILSLPISLLHPYNLYSQMFGDQLLFQSVDIHIM
mgnify:CR=1 FL=1